METKEFIRGNFYRTRDGLKVECVHVFPDRTALVVFDPVRQYCQVRPDGRAAQSVNDMMDILGPWRDPAQMRVGMYRHKTTGHVRVWDEITLSENFGADLKCWELVETWTLTEGTGNVSG